MAQPKLKAPRQNAHDAKKPQKPQRKTTNTNSSGSLFSLRNSYSAVGVALIGVVSWFAYQGYLETRVNTPIKEPKVVVESGLDIPERYWGSYRPGTYFGLKTRDPHSLLAGLMWFMPKLAMHGDLGIRHWCDQGDNLERYGWLEHDGRNFGVQEIVDKFIKLETSFVKRPNEGQHGGDWTARIHIEPRVPDLKDELVTLFFYFTLDDEGKGIFQPVRAIDNLNPDAVDSTDSIKHLGLSALQGYTEKLGDFHVKFVHADEGSIVHTAYLSTNVPSPHLAKEALMNGLRLMEDKRTKARHISLAGNLFAKDDTLRQPNFVVHQVTAKVPFTLEVVYQSQSSSSRLYSLQGKVYDAELKGLRDEFTENFESKFKLFEKGFSEAEIKFAKAAIINLLGGVGYFHGSSKVISKHNKEPVPYWNAPLYTAVPSRSFFPRGFLWDEGFHNLLISQWDREISVDIISHWFDLMNIEGWIPREQILGSEARARVPDEFIVQKNDNGNPPTLLLALDSMFSSLSTEDLSNQELEFLSRLWPRLVTWYNWFNVSQVGSVPGTYHWRGRDANAVRELNPKSLSSGLDDYPRASHPTLEDRHLDLRCWMALSAKVLAKIADLIGRDSRRYHEAYDFLADNQLLNEQHWSPAAKRYSDYGLHSSSVTLKRPKVAQGQPKPDMVRVVLEEPTVRFVDDTFGYVSLFPLITQILDPHLPQLGQLLQDLRSTNLLWTKYGLRSLAKNAPLYNKRNTEHDPPYWRGAIWINVNFLVARSLHHYASVEGPHQARAKVLYNELRENLIRNMVEQYYQTGYIWEQYNDATGAGQGSRPFTGWSSLIVLLMSEHF